MRRTLLAAGIALVASLLAGCASPYVVDPAPYAADPDCASVGLAMPSAVGGLEVRQTTSQATFAYGEEFPIVARCGVEPPGPTELPCVSIDTRAGIVDWLVIDEEGSWRAVVFGRSPALELTIPKERADSAVGDVLAEVSGPAALAPSNGLECR